MTRADRDRDRAPWSVDTHYNVYIMIYVHAQHCT